MKVKDGIMGFTVGDALGVPVEFKSRLDIKKNPVMGMRGYGVHNQPKGYWSDDSSMTFCTIESIIENNYINYKDIMNKFSKWKNKGYWTPNNEIFDIGMAVSESIDRWDLGMDIEKCGSNNKYSNGTGSLMRMLPLAYFLNKKGYKRVESVGTYCDCYNLSALTHGNTISKNCCVIYVDMAMQLLNGESIDNAFNNLKHFEQLILPKDFKLFDSEFKNLPKSKIGCVGYVVSALETVLWVLLNTDSYKNAVLGAVNLGGDTDTVGALVGGLAGIYYGYNSIPEEWINCIARKNDILDLCNRFENI